MSQRLLIVINFGDNDFRKTWEGVLRTVHMSWKYYGDQFPTDKRELLHLINALGPIAYRLFQQHQGPVPLPSEGIAAYVSNLGEQSLLVGDEAQEWLDKFDNWDWSTHVLDTNLDYPENDVVWTR